MGVRCVAFILLTGILSAQSPTEYVRQALLRIASGQLEAVRSELSSWVTRYPNDPAILFLQAATLSDAQQARALYERIVREFPSSEWADDALCRLVQEAALRRDSLRAWQLFEQLRRTYPTSDFLPYAWETMRATVGLPPELRATATGNTRPYTLQVGLFRQLQHAQRERERLRRHRLRAEIVPRIWQNVVHYAVVVGTYERREDAEAARSAVAQRCQCQPLIIEHPAHAAP